MRSRKPIVYFDDKIAQSLVPPKPTKPTKPLAKPAKACKPTKNPAKSTPPTIATPLAKPLVLDDAVEGLCSQIEGLDVEEDLKTKKKAKAAEVARLTALGLQGIMEEAKPLKDVQFETFNPRVPREPKVNIPSNINPSNPLALLSLPKYIQLLQKTLICTLLPAMQLQYQLLQTGEFGGQQIQMKSAFYLVFSTI
jgi:hypothetical protein